jgi:hypothetical protein
MHYNNFHAANLKEYISPHKEAKQDFQSETCFDLIPDNSNAFSAEIKKIHAIWLRISAQCPIQSSLANPAGRKGIPVIPVTFPDY